MYGSERYRNRKERGKKRPNIPQPPAPSPAQDATPPASAAADASSASAHPATHIQCPCPWPYPRDRGSTAETQNGPGSAIAKTARLRLNAASTYSRSRSLVVPREAHRGAAAGGSWGRFVRHGGRMCGRIGGRGIWRCCGFGFRVLRGVGMAMELELELEMELRGHGSLCSYSKRRVCCSVVGSAVTAVAAVELRASRLASCLAT
jgi:hypothetical protein